MEPAGMRQAAAVGTAGGGGGSHAISVKHLSREDLEDRYYRLKDTHQELKKLSKGQEDKMKRMATKLIRLTNDFKKEKQVSGVDVENRDFIEDLRGQVRDWKSKYEAVSRKHQICRQELEARQRQQGPYRNVQARIDTGIPRSAPKARADAQDSSRAPRSAPSQPQQVSPTLPRYGHSLLEEERSRTADLQQIITDLEAELEQQRFTTEATQEGCVEKMKLQQASHGEEMEKLKRVLLETQRKNISDDVSLIKLQREVREKSAQLGALQTKFLTAEQQVEKVKVNHAGVMSELSDLQARLREEEEKCQKLQHSVSGNKLTKQSVVELQEMVEDLRAEKKLLQESNEKLVASAFDAKVERQHRAELQLLQDRITLLESSKKNILMEKSDLLEQLASDKEQLASARKEASSMSLTYFKLKEEHEKLTEKMEFFSRESSVDFSQLEEALAFIRSRKTGELPSTGFIGGGSVEPFPGELENLVSQKRQMEMDINRLQTVYTQTRQELEKTRHLLRLQCKINKEGEEERQIMERKLIEVEAESEQSAKEHKELLERRAAKIKRLEQQMHDMAYGTRQLRYKPAVEDVDLDALADGVTLEPGQNRLQIHLGQVKMTADAEEALGEAMPPLCFLSLDVLDFETVVTDTLPGTSMDFNTTAEYTVAMDDFFLHALQTSFITLDVHSSAAGASWATVASGRFQIKDLLSDDKKDRIHGLVTLIGTEPHAGVPFATITFWARLRCPVDQALRLYRERLKAHAYLKANRKVEKDAASSTIMPVDDGGEAESFSSVLGASNQLKIVVESCSDLPLCSGQQPSPYVVYKLWNQPDHTTSIVNHSNMPQFNDVCRFSLPASSDLDEFLHSQVLTFYVFDDTGKDYTSYLGTADLILLPLLRQTVLEEACVLLSPHGKPSGQLHLHLSWDKPFISAAATAAAASKAAAVAATAQAVTAAASRTRGREGPRFSSRSPPASRPATDDQTTSQATHTDDGGGGELQQRARGLHRADGLRRGSPAQSTSSLEVSDLDVDLGTSSTMITPLSTQDAHEEHAAVAVDDRDDDDDDDADDGDEDGDGDDFDDDDSGDDFDDDALNDDSDGAG